jgi:iron complex transport system permease protein
VWLWGLVALAAVLGAPFIGAFSIPVSDALRGTLDETAQRILFDIRVPRVLIAFLTGAALGLGGLVFQTVFRNVLATPYTLGVSSGAALGAAIYFKLGAAVSLCGIAGSTIAALGGAVVVVLVIDRIAARNVPATTLLLCGVVVALFSGSLISFLEYTSGFTTVFQLSRWLMGGLDAVAPAAVLPLLPLIIGAFVVIGLRIGNLNILALGDELAAARGVDAFRERRVLLVVVSLMIGAVVSFAGPIGFVGMIVPQALRLILGVDNRRLLPATIFAAGAFLVVCDTVARTISAPFELPVGIVTALLGGPYFLVLLLRTSGPSSRP